MIWDFVASLVKLVHVVMRQDWQRRAATSTTEVLATGNYSTGNSRLTWISIERWKELQFTKLYLPPSLPLKLHPSTIFKRHICIGTILCLLKYGSEVWAQFCEKVLWQTICLSLRPRGNSAMSHPFKWITLSFCNFWNWTKCAIYLYLVFSSKKEVGLVV